MRTLIIAIAALAFLAAPAIAQPVLTKDVDVKLSIEAYATLRNMPTEITINFSSADLAGGVLTRMEPIWGDIVANTTPVVTVAIVPVSGAVGSWSVDPVILTLTANPAVWTVGTGVRVTVPPAQAPMTASKQATVTFTITSPV